VTLRRLVEDSDYATAVKMSLAWLLRTEPSEHLT
jgi:hypothetical protein